MYIHYLAPLQKPYRGIHNLQQNTVKSLYMSFSVRKPPESDILYYIIGLSIILHYIIFSAVK